MEINATHLMGGNLSYRYIGEVGNGNVRYRLTLKIYRDCGQSTVDFDNEISIGIYKNESGFPKLYDAKVPLITQKNIAPPWNAACEQKLKNLNFCIKEGYFEADIDVPKSTNGYHLWYQRCCRNKQMNAKDDEGQGYYAFIPNTNIKNSSPDFTTVPTPLVCVGDTIDLSNSTTDPDGDSLVYSLEWPYDGGSSTAPMPDPPTTLPTLPLIGYNTGYSYLKPFGTNGVCLVNSQTGICRYLILQKGYYSVAIEVKEYRNGTFLSKVRRDVQILATDLCEANEPPVLISGSKGTQGNPFVITEGDKLCFTPEFNDTNYQYLNLVVSGDPLSGSGGVQPPLATMSNATGKGYVKSEFCWQTGCSHGRTLPYIIYLAVNDDGCPEKKVLVSYFIQVNPFIATSMITGDSIVCLNKKGIKYTVPNPRSDYTYTWSVNNGTITSGQGSPSIFVDFNNVGQARIILQMKNQAGCEATPDTQDIIVLPPVYVQPVTGDTNVCEYESGLVYGISPTAGSKYKWFIRGGTIVSGSNTNQVIVNWGVKGQGWIGVMETSQYGCPSDTMFLNVNILKPDPKIIDGTPSVCPNIKGVVYSVETTTGSQFFWKITGGVQSSGGTGASITVNWGNKGLGKVQVLELNQYGCPGDTQSMDVLIDHALVGEIPSGDTVICAYTTHIVYSVKYTNGSTYNWTVIGGNIQSGQGTASIYVNWGIDGQGSVSVIETSYDSINNLPCFSQPNTLYVRIAPLPSVDKIIGPMKFCQTELTQTWTASGNLGSHYIWKLDGSDLNNDATTLDYIFNSPGAFTLSVQEITADSCIGDVIDTILEVYPKPLTSPILGDSFICFPNFLNHEYKVTGYPGSTYLWSLKNGVIRSGQGTENIMVDWLGFNPVDLFVVEFSQFGCKGDTIRKDVYIDKPSISMQYVTVGIQEEDANEVYWEVLNAPFYNKPFNIYRRLADSKDSFELIATIDSSNRTFTDRKVDVYSHAYEYYVEGYNLCGDPMKTSVHTTMLLKGNKVDGYDVSLFWSRYFGWITGVSNYNLIRKLSDDINYNGYEATIDTQVYYQNGFDSWQQCYRTVATQKSGKFTSYSNKICFVFDPILWVPNAFTPNDDRLNDEFILKGGSLKHFEITIFNRWGERLFHSEKLDESWDGNFQGKPCQADAYVYVVKYYGFDNIIKIETGSLQLLR